MNNRPECLPCCLRRILRTADLVTNDEWLHRKLLGEVMQELCRVDELATPAEVIYSVSRRAAKTLGVTDPYAEEKRRWIEETTGNLDVIGETIDKAGDPFLQALKLSIGANLIDCELRESVLPGFSLKTLLAGIDDLPFALDHVEDFRVAVAEAEQILFVHDTAGELLFDRLLIEKMEKPKEAVLSVVREAPILGDATREDAAAVGLNEVAEIIDPGIGCLGIPLNACSKRFREAYARSSLVIAKGQAAYETLEDKGATIDGVDKEIFFLLRVKCQVMARQLGAKLGECVLEPN